MDPSLVINLASIQYSIIVIVSQARNETLHVHKIISNTAFHPNWPWVKTFTFYPGAHDNSGNFESIAISFKALGLGIALHLWLLLFVRPV